MPEFSALVRELGRRVARIVSDNSRGVGNQARDDLIDSIQGRIVSLVFESAPTRKGEFLEVSFRKVARGLALNAVEAHFARANEYSEVRIADTVTEEDVGVVVADPALPPDDLMILFEGLDAITDPRHREAFVLRYGYNWPIDPSDPNVATLCRHFDVKERQINTWLRTAMSQVRARIGENL
ncbi:sigma-70 family RNA polymerase sigma factor [Gemmata obscuriglobus]|uniref:Sigma-70 family RNA polymerase sigma factor n=2 Tax=Gemmata obscuriglobus TaxID=114 RepID=A0A2Z3H6H3_9BACT|nr:sigma-70 family RNA polymerase sigma factor [Gemmata obscuriglobus]